MAWSFNVIYNIISWLHPFVKVVTTMKSMLVEESATLIIWREILLKQIQLTVFGNVQGVGFRYFSQMKAVQYGVKGFVRNQTDGSVKIIVEGTQDQLSLFIEDVRKGNPFSKVDDILVEESNKFDGYTSFMIKY